MFFRTLSGRFLLLTIIFVMLAEVLIFVPSVARFRQDFLLTRLERAQIASLALLASPGFIDEALAGELLENAGVFNVVLRRDAVRELVLSSPLPQPVSQTFDLRDPGAVTLMRDAIAVLLVPESRVIRVIGHPVREAGLLIEVTLETGPLRAEMLEFGRRIFWLSLIISVSTALLLFVAVQLLMVAPIRRLVRAMASYAEAPEDARRIVIPTSRVRELREAEDALHQLQTQLTGNLRQKERLAQLGGAVARISHDLRNILASASLFADRMESSADPVVTRAAPKLLNALSRAINLCESTLAFGRAEEPPPRLARIALAPLIAEVVEAEQLAATGAQPVEFLIDVRPGLSLSADHEQLFRVFTNLVRNARQAIETSGRPGSIEVSAFAEDDDVVILVGDTGPGLPEKAREHLFTAFQGGARKGGFGLGLAIAAELVRGHGGALELQRSDPEGTTFRITIPHAR